MLLFFIKIPQTNLFLQAKGKLQQKLDQVYQPGIKLNQKGKNFLF